MIIKQKVLFDDVFFNIANTGIARVWRSIFTHLSNNKNLIPDDFEFIILNRSDELANLGFKTIDFPQYDFWLPNMDRTLLTQLAHQECIDLVVSSYYTFAIGINTLMPVYDLIPEQFGFHRESRGWLERELGFTYAKSFFAISKNTKSDLIKSYKFVYPEQVSVSYPGIDINIFKPAERSLIENFKHEHSLNNYLVMVGSREGYKNGELVFSAIKNGDLEGFDLVLVGGEEPSAREIQVASDAHIALRHLKLTDSELAICLSGSRALIYPSRYEGFGLPPLEALACGTPILVLKTSSIPESVGNLGIFLDLQYSSNFQLRLQESQAPSWREKINKEGPRWAAQFSWERMSLDFIHAIYSTLKNSPTKQAAKLDEYLLNYTNFLNNYRR
jgi:glycosyltransferase involved in cell wall biosynthesis